MSFQECLQQYNKVLENLEQTRDEIKYKHERRKKKEEEKCVQQ